MTPYVTSIVVQSLDYARTSLGLCLIFASDLFQGISQLRTESEREDFFTSLMPRINVQLIRSLVGTISDGISCYETCGEKCTST